MLNKKGSLGIYGGTKIAWKGDAGELPTEKTKRHRKFSMYSALSMLAGLDSLLRKLQKTAKFRPRKNHSPQILEDTKKGDK